MALKLKENTTASRGVDELNFLGEGTYVEGIVETKGSLRIDGRVKGAVKAGDTLTIGAKGVVAGEIHSRTAVVGGRIEGNIKVDEKLVLEANSVLVGNLKAKKLVIDEGAVFQGKSDMGAVAESPKAIHPAFQEKGGSKSGEQPSETKQ